jgi:putative ABC transport system substrate-binding protein
MATAGDPVASGLVTSLARPGGNITGLTLISPDLSGKRLELLKEMIPGLARVAVLVYRDNPATDPMLKETETAAVSLGLQLQILEMRASTEVQDALESAFAAAKKNRFEALDILSSAFFNERRKEIGNLAVKTRLPTMFPYSSFTEAGGLISYGPNLLDLYRRAAYFVDKILKGAKPADLPVEQPTKFELVINLKTAKQIGLTIPPNVLARADRVIK